MKLTKTDDGVVTVLMTEDEYIAAAMVATWMHTAQRYSGFDQPVCGGVTTAFDAELMDQRLETFKTLARSVLAAERKETDSGQTS